MNGLTCSAWKLLQLKVDSPFLLMIFFSHLHYDSGRSTILSRIIKVDSDDSSHPESLDALGPGRRMLNKYTLTW